MAEVAWIYNNYYADIAIKAPDKTYVFKRWTYTGLTSEEVAKFDDAAYESFSRMLERKLMSGLLVFTTDEPEQEYELKTLCVGSLTVYENGTYEAPEGMAYSSVTVSVGEGGGSSGGSSSSGMVDIGGGR